MVDQLHNLNFSVNFGKVRGVQLGFVDDFNGNLNKIRSFQFIYNIKLASN